MSFIPRCRLLWWPKCRGWSCIATCAAICQSIHELQLVGVAASVAGSFQIQFTAPATVTELWQEHWSLPYPAGDYNLKQRPGMCILFDYILMCVLASICELALSFTVCNQVVKFDMPALCQYVDFCWCWQAWVTTWAVHQGIRPADRVRLQFQCVYIFAVKVNLQTFANLCVNWLNMPKVLNFSRVPSDFTSCGQVNGIISQVSLWHGHGPA